MSKQIRLARLFIWRQKHWLWISGVSLLLLGLLAPAQYTPLSRVDATTRAAPLEVQVDGTEQLAGGIKRLIQDFEARSGGRVAVSFKLLKDDLEIIHNQDQAFKSASLYKLFVAHRSLELVDDRLLSLDQKVNKKQTLKSCLRKIITVSDNPCGVKLQKLINPHSTNQLLAERGYGNTDISGEYPTTSAADVSRLLEDAYRRRTLSSSSGKLLMDWLKEQRINDRLPAELPSGVEVAHKTGDLPGVSHDAGIVYAGQHYILSVLSENSELDLAGYNGELAYFSKEVYKLVEANF